MQQTILTTIENTLANFDFAYMLTVNVLTYIIISTLDYWNGNRPVRTIHKRICLVISIIIVTFSYWLDDYEHPTVLVNSAIAAPVFWSWVVKPALRNTKFDYRKIDKYLN